MIYASYDWIYWFNKHYSCPLWPVTHIVPDWICSTHLCFHFLLELNNLNFTSLWSQLKCHIVQRLLIRVSDLWLSCELGLNLISAIILRLIGGVGSIVEISLVKSLSTKQSFVAFVWHSLSEGILQGCVHWYLLIVHLLLFSLDSSDIALRLFVTNYEYWMLFNDTFLRNGLLL